MNALELLKQDHQKVKGLFQEIRKSSDRSKQKELFDKIDTELEMHTHIEETIFYPAVEKHEEMKDMVRESLKEHNQVKILLREIEKITPDDEEFDEKFEDLIECVEHHAEEEEEGKMFPKLRQIMKAAELEQLGRELEAAKQKRPARKAG